MQFSSGEKLFERSSDICFIVNNEGIVLDVNQSASKATGYTAYEILNKPLLSIISHKFHRSFNKSFQNALKDKPVQNIELELISKNGTPVNVSLVFTSLLENHNPNPLVFVSARDISEQKLAQEQLLRFANAIHYTINPIEITDVDGKIIYVNSAFEKITGYTKAELIGKNPSILSSGRHSKEFWRQMWTTILSGKVWTGEVENLHKNGSIIFVRLLISPIIDAAGNVISFLGTHQDLTDQKKLESELHERQAYLAAIMQDSADAIIGLDLDYRIRSWNRGAEKIYGYREEEVIGKNFSILIPHDLVENGELEKIDKEVKSRGYISNYETERLTKDGQRISIQLTRTLVRDSSGKVIGSSAIVRDVTELKRLKRQIGHAEKLSVVGQLAAGIAHEVGNPLTSISSLVQVIQRTTNDSFAQEKLELVKNQINRIAKTIRELVDFSRPSNYEIKPTDINKVIQDAVNIVRYGKKAKDVNFILELDQTLPRFTVVQDQIIQVFINLLLNAVDATEGKPGEIRVSSKMRGSDIHIIVKDNGKGIADDIKEKIFEPFFTTKKLGEGTGLGLWVSYGIVKNFNGEIDVRSEVGKGSTFIVSLPTR